MIPNSTAKTICLFGCVNAAAAAFGLTIAAVPWVLFSESSSNLKVGMTVGAYAAGAVGARLVWGRLTDHKSLGFSLLFGSGVLVFGSICYLLPPSFWFIAKLVQGAGTAIIYMAGFGWAGKSGRKDAGQKMGLLGGAITAPITIMPAVGLALTKIELSYVRVAIIALAVLSVSTAFGHYRLAPHTEGRDLAFSEPSKWHPPWSLLIGLGLIAAPLGILEAFLPLIATRALITDPALLYLCFGIALASGRTVGGVASDRAAPARVAVGASMVVAALLAMGIAARSPPITYLLTGLIGVAAGAGISGVFASVSAVTPYDRQASTMGYAGTFHDVGVACGAMAGGAMVAGAASAMSAGSALALVAACSIASGKTATSSASFKSGQE